MRVDYTNDIENGNVQIIPFQEFRPGTTKVCVEI